MGLHRRARDAGAGAGAGRAGRGPGRHARGGGGRARARRTRIDEPRDVARLRAAHRRRRRASTRPTSTGAGQTRDGGDDRGARRARPASPGRPRPTSRATCGAEPFIESDAPEIRAEAREGRRRASRHRARAPSGSRATSTRSLEKKPTVSLPSAREVLRTRVGDCNEHTALYVAMARALGIPARIAVGLVYVRGAFYYHAWPEVYIEEARGRGLLAAGRSDAQPVPRRRHARAPRARRPRQAGRDPAADRPAPGSTMLDVELRPGADARSSSAAPPTDLRPLDLAAAATRRQRRLLVAAPRRSQR